MWMVVAAGVPADQTRNVYAAHNHRHVMGGNGLHRLVVDADPGTDLSGQPGPVTLARHDVVPVQLGITGHGVVATVRSTHDAIEAAVRSLAASPGTSRAAMK